MGNKVEERRSLEVSVMRWIQALHLEQWSESISARTELSEIISDLIRASAADIGGFRFPTGDSAQVPGYDGRLTATEAPPYVPGGASVWEFGVARDYVGKANEDYISRTENPRSILPNSTTFVFVTSRRWVRGDITIDQWLAQRVAEGKWKDVRAIDAIALEEWLSQQPAVSLQFARKLGLAPHAGVQSTDQFWEEYAARFDPVLNEDVLVAGRLRQAEEIVQQLKDQPHRHVWQADSSEEVIAFAVAAIRKADSAIRKFLESRTVVVSTEDGARELAHRQNLIFLPRAGAQKLDAFLGQRNATVIAIGRDGPSREGASVLNRPTSDELVEALKKMGIEETRAQKIGRTCGRSVTVLARRIPSGSAARPEWDGKIALLPALLAGGWNARTIGDQNVLRNMAGTASYEEYEDTLRPFLRMQDPPVEREGDVWKVRAPVDAFVHLAHLVGNSDLARFRSAVESVFSELDPSLDLSVEERPYAGLRGVSKKHSEWLRGGLATSLLLISVFHQHAGMTASGLNAEKFVNDLLGSLPGLDEDYRVFASFHGELLLLMEAAPRPLLMALGRLLEGDGQRIRPIFQDQEHSVFGSRSPHTAVLWALEMLAWDPAYISEATLLLARLARIDPGGKLANRPLQSLREVLLPWHPNTNANLIQRLAALDRIVVREPDVGWQLVVKLLPEFQSIGSNTPKPRYREAGASERERITNGLVGKAYNEIIDRVLRLVNDIPVRWVSVIHNISSFSPQDRNRTIELLEKFATHSRNAEQVIVWSALRDEINRHRAYRSAKWAMQDTDLKRLEEVLARIEPSDTATKMAWLFDDYHPDIPVPGGLARIEVIEQLRREAVESLLNTDGYASLVAMAERVKLPHFLAGAAVAAIIDVSCIEDLVNRTIGKSDSLDTFAISLSAQALHKFGNEWKNCVAKNFSQGRWTSQYVTSLLLNWPDRRDTWGFASSLSEEVESDYWKRKPGWFPGEATEAQQAAEKYIEVGRPLTAIRALHSTADSLSAEVIFALLDNAIAELNSSPGHATHNIVYEVEDLFEALRKRDGVLAVEIAKREYAYLPLFGYGEKTLTIHSLLGEDPPLFVSILCDVFKPETDEPQETNEDRIARARIGYRLLSDFRGLPGWRDGQINAEGDKKWVSEVRRLAAAENRSTMADEFVGRILAYSPHDSDGAWPHGSISALIEDLASDKIELGIEIERVNMRGVTTRGPYEGGDQERELASTFRGWANARGQWLRTAGLLNRIAESWEREGQREDERAKQDAMRFE